MATGSEAVGQVASEGRGRCLLLLDSLVPFPSVQDSGHETVQFSFWVNLPTSVNPVKKMAVRCSERLPRSSR